ncbi:MAG: hypothetical protein IKC21_00935, partial [Ruminococcus sp.]|nr:hypothetical protein [Ruminococcus sp.]
MAKITSGKVFTFPLFCVKIIYRASLKTRLIKGKADRYGSCKETFRRRAAALRGRVTQQMLYIAAFSQKGFLEMPYSILLL